MKIDTILCLDYSFEFIIVYGNIIAVTKVRMSTITSSCQTLYHYTLKIKPKFNDLHGKVCIRELVFEEHIKSALSRQVLKVLSIVPVKVCTLL